MKFVVDAHLPPGLCALLKALFQTFLSTIVTALEQNSLVELDRQKVQAIV